MYDPGFTVTFTYYLTNKQVRKLLQLKTCLNAPPLRCLKL